MCQPKAKGGLRCPSSAKKRLVSAQQSGDEKAIREAKHDYYMTNEGLDRLREDGREDIASRYEKRREMVQRRNQVEWRRENKITIALDLDNTTADFTGAMRAHLAKKQGLTFEQAMEKYPEPSGYDMPEWFESRKEFLPEFLEAEKAGIYKNMKLFSGARKGINDLHHDGFRIDVVTARNENYTGDTKHALRRYRLPYRTLQHLEEKETFDAHIFFDDSPKQVKTLKMNGKKVAVYHQKYNASDGEGSPRLEGWKNASAVAAMHTTPDEPESHH